MSAKNPSETLPFLVCVNSLTSCGMPFSFAKARSPLAVMRLSSNISLPPPRSSQPRHTVTAAPFNSSASIMRLSCAVKSVKPSMNISFFSPMELCPICSASRVSRSVGSAWPFATTASNASKMSARSYSLSPSAPAQLCDASMSCSEEMHAVLSSSTAESSIVCSSAFLRAEE